MNPTLVACMQACFHPTFCRWLAVNMGIEAFEGILRTLLQIYINVVTLLTD